MRQEEIDREVWRCVTGVTLNGEKLTELGKIRPMYGPGAHQLDVDARTCYLETDGMPPLEIFIVPDEDQKGFDVHVTRIGNVDTYNALEERSVPTIKDVLPVRIFKPGDTFLEAYDDSLPLSAGQYSVYTKLCEELKPKTILEIGVRAGYSAYAMLSAVPEATYQGIDADNGTNGGEKGYYLYAQEMLEREFPNASVTIHKDDSQQLLCLDRRYDLIHIDGGHNHDEALHDLELCRPWGDWLLVDDTASISTVRSAVVEFLEKYRYPAWRYETWHGFVLIDTREAAGAPVGYYYPQAFDAQTIGQARLIALNEYSDKGLTTDSRWESETPWLLDQMTFPPGGLLFDLGCGPGRLSLPLVQRKHPVLGIDLSYSMRARANEYVGSEAQFGTVSPDLFAAMVENGLRGQGALAVWALQHMLTEHVELMARTLWKALESGSMLYTFESAWRCVPSVMLGQFVWLKDTFSVPEALQAAGFELLETLAPPDAVFPSDEAVFHRYRRR